VKTKVSTSPQMELRAAWIANGPPISTAIIRIQCTGGALMAMAVNAITALKASVRDRSRYVLRMT
jgi:hypothetical protein